MKTTAATAPTGLPTSELARLEASFPARAVALRGGGLMSVRECGSGPALVCLHGIGSGAASWLDTALRLAPQATRTGIAGGRSASRSPPQSSSTAWR